MSEDKDIKKVSAKLDLIASLLLDMKQGFGEKMSVKDRVGYLVKRGVSEDEDISAILGITKSHASKEKAIIKKEEKKNNGREETI